MKQQASACAVTRKHRKSHFRTTTSGTVDRGKSIILKRTLEMTCKKMFPMAGGKNMSILRQFEAISQYFRGGLDMDYCCQCKNLQNINV